MRERWHLLMATEFAGVSALKRTLTHKHIKERTGTKAHIHTDTHNKHTGTKAHKQAQRDRELMRSTLPNTDGEQPTAIDRTTHMA